MRSVAAVGYAVLALGLGGPLRPASSAPVAVAPSRNVERVASVPRDVRALVVEDRSGMNVIVRRPEHLVALELGKVRAAGLGEARVTLHAREVPAFVWETTDRATLVTVRGTLRVGRDRTTHLAMSAAPHVTDRLEGHKHRCLAHRDVGNGFVATCSVSAARVRAANFGARTAMDDVWIVDGARSGEKVVRLALPLVQPANAGVVSYRIGSLGVVVRAEASRAGGPQLVLLANEKRQPEPEFF